MSIRKLSIFFWLESVAPQWVPAFLLPDNFVSIPEFTVMLALAAQLQASLQACAGDAQAQISRRR
nr:MAG TPA: hypothetical protein [Caudoviricetes sp.]